MSSTALDLMELERDGWQALSSGPDAALDFYGRVLDAEVTMLLPGGLAITDRDRALESMSGAPWDTFALHDLRTTQVSADVGLVTYAVTAQRAEVEYSALVSSLYVQRDGLWRMAFHQQTPR